MKTIQHLTGMCGEIHHEFNIAILIIAFIIYSTKTTRKWQKKI